ncbi:MAG: sensor domain-containing diguanylate cyclase [Sphingomonas sp.]|uniref:sensor domain-containing diguanylate cyclase n=1 Tax=Sphingomonas sp. TaxID=28214 RepID=UPI003F81ABB7
MRSAGHFAWIITAVLLAVASLWSPPAAARSAIIGEPLAACVATVRTGDSPAVMFASPARFDCTRRQTSYGQGDFWVISQPLDHVAGVDARSRVRIASLWQDGITLYALYPGGAVHGWRLDGRATNRHIQLGAIIEWPLPAELGSPIRLMWHVQGSANLRGILLAPTIATPTQSSQANMLMTALYAGFGGLCLALLIYNLAMWGALRHPFQLAYCGMVAALMLYAITSSGALAWIYPAMANNDRLKLNYVLLCTAAAAALTFARYFFAPAVTAGWVGKAVNMITAATVLATAALVLLAPWHIHALDTAFSLTFGAIVIVVFPIIARARAERSPHVWLFAIAWAAPILFAALRLLGNLTLIPWSFWLDNSTILSMAFEAIISTLAIAYRIRLLSIERDEAIEREVITARLADTDPLTGLLNRRAFLRQAIGREGAQALILTDLDHFKRINETLGHDGGDEVLRVFARTLRQAAPGALIARMGGEEFAVLAPVERAVTPDAVLAKLRAARMPFDLTVTASIGACTGPLTTEPDWKSMYRCADRALFDAKQAGRDRARFAPPLAVRAA